jgi:D-serine deaminase-like pyridoxal phosphate-dependent protein
MAVELVKSAGIELRFVNGGGTGSLSSTKTEECVTEVTVGSGLYAPHLFDGYKEFQLGPAMCYSLPIVRHPSTHLFTALGGGYVASGTGEPSKIPLPYLPQGLSLLKHEAAGEVQTPLHYLGHLGLGDLVFFRHAKAGEVCERFNEIHLLRKNKIENVIPTYRGEGQAFL